MQSLFDIYCIKLSVGNVIYWIAYELFRADDEWCKGICNISNKNTTISEQCMIIGPKLIDQRSSMVVHSIGCAFVYTREETMSI